MFKLIKKEIKEMYESDGLMGVFAQLFFIVVIFTAFFGMLLYMTLNWGSTPVKTETTQTETTIKYKIRCDDSGPYRTNSYTIDQNMVKFNEDGTNYICTDFIIKEINY